MDQIDLDKELNKLSKLTEKEIDEIFKKSISILVQL